MYRVRVLKLPLLYLAFEKDETYRLDSKKCFTAYNAINFRF